MKKPYIKSIAVLAISLGLFSCGDSYKMSKAEEKRLEEIAKFIDSNPSVSSLNSELFSDVDDGYAKAVEALIEGGADPNYKAVITVAATRGHTNIVRTLIQRGANVNAQSQMSGSGFRALHIAALKGNIEMVNVLIEGGADVNVKGNYGHTPLDAAKENGCSDIIKILKEAGAKE